MIKLGENKANRPTARRLGLKMRPGNRRGLSNNFANRVFEVVRNISRGELMTYREVAKAAGSPRAYRAVGNILKKNYNSKIPCHRVIRSDGSLGNYNRGRKIKINLLNQEKTAM